VSWDATPICSVDADEKTDTDVRQGLLKPWNVILLDDDHHTYEYVVEMVRAVFGMTPERAYLHACEVDSMQRTILISTSREHAELKQEQVHAYGPDPRIPRCAGSMTAIIEPAP
jgi:ATP-dependent Clp protease adaptor protein ClpS